MSKYLAVKTEFTDPVALREALELWATEHGKVVEFHEVPQNLHGYAGDVRPEKANFIIRRQHVGSMANDVGFEIMDDGSVRAHISEYDQNRGGKAILDGLAEPYAYNKVMEAARKRGLSVAREWRDQQTGERMVQFTGWDR